MYVKTFSDKYIASANQKVSSEFRELARTNHPDKVGGDDKMIGVFKLTNGVYDFQEEAFQILGSFDTYIATAYPEHVQYDWTGDDLCETFHVKFVKRYLTRYLLTKLGIFSRKRIEKKSTPKHNPLVPRIREMTSLSSSTCRITGSK